MEKTMRNMDRLNRRVLVAAAGTAGVASILLGSPKLCLGKDSAKEKKDEKEHPVTPAEDLMFEHGVLERLLLIYAEMIRRIDAGERAPARPLAEAAGLFRRFGEDYHERLEEDHIFPVLEKTGQNAELARELKKQHDAGRKITSSLLEMTKGETLAQPQQTAQALRSFYRMYVPHISRENSVAFRAFQETVPHQRYVDLGEQFEKREHELFGEDGFEKTLAQVATIEDSLGIRNLAQFTPA